MHSYYRHAINGELVHDTKSFWEAEREERRLNMCDYEDLPELILQDENGEEHANPEYEND